MRRAELERLLDQVPDHPAPRAELEQYRTPGSVAAAFAWAAREDLEGRRVLDLGCGTGVLAVAAAALGATEVLGVDIDGAAVALAQRTVRELGVSAGFEVADIASWSTSKPWDTVIMNPPFGAQRANRGADRPFYRTAAAAAPVAWVLAPMASERFLAAHVRDAGGAMLRAQAWDYPLPARFAFHSEEARIISVAAYRCAWRQPG